MYKEVKLQFKLTGSNEKHRKIIIQVPMAMKCLEKL